jgi:hypothetical protein
MAYREPKMTTYLAHFMIEQLTDKKRFFGRVCKGFTVKQKTNCFLTKLKFKYGILN